MLLAAFSLLRYPSRVFKLLSIDVHKLAAWLSSLKKSRGREVLDLDSSFGGSSVTLAASLSSFKKPRGSEILDLDFSFEGSSVSLTAGSGCDRYP